MGEILFLTQKKALNMAPALTFFFFFINITKILEFIFFIFRKHLYLVCLPLATQL